MKSKSKSENLKVWNLTKNTPIITKEHTETPWESFDKTTNVNFVLESKKLTEVYGPAGAGWTVEIVKQWHETMATGTVVAFTNILLYIKGYDSAIPGTGGSIFFANTKEYGTVTFADAFQTVLMKAFSNACKTLGIGADAYLGAGTIENEPYSEPFKKTQAHCKKDSSEPGFDRCEICGNEITSVTLTKNGKSTTHTPAAITKTSMREFGLSLCYGCLVDLGKTKTTLENKN